jgi:hypothetical protein
MSIENHFPDVEKLVRHILIGAREQINHVWLNLKIQLRLNSQ